MAEGGSRGKEIPVVFYDGEREIDIGDVYVHPNLELKPFQLMLSRKIGISLNQISIYLVNRKRSPTSPIEGHRIPLRGTVNFDVLTRRHDELSFLVALKRSKRSRTRRERSLVKGFVDYGDTDYEDYFTEHEFSPPYSSPENKVLRRRDDTRFPIYDQNSPAGPSSLRRRSDSAGGSDRMSDSHSDHGGATMLVGNGYQKFHCEICEKSEKRGPTTSFHHCVNDQTVSGFVTLFGPIARPEHSRK